MDPTLIGALAAALLGGFAQVLLSRWRKRQRQMEFEQARQEAIRSYKEAKTDGSKSGLPPRLRAADGSSLEQRAAALAETLTIASKDLGGLLQEMQQITQRRLAAVSEQEHKLRELSEREESLQTRLARLEGTSPEAAQEFIRLLQQQLAETEARAATEQRRSEARSAKRDYLLFWLVL
jgi:hypothetical protein